MRPLKITFVHELFPPKIAGGGEILVAKTVEELSKRGHDVNVVTTGDPSDTHWKQIPVRRLPVNRFLLNLAVAQIAAEAKGADLVHCVTYNSAVPSWLYAKLSGKPVVCSVLSFHRDRWTDIIGPVKGTLYKYLEDFILKRSYDAWIFPSEFSRDEAVDIGIPAERTAVARPGIDTRTFKPGRKENYVLFVSKLVEQKGVQYLVEAAKSLPEIRFKIVGDGPAAAGLKSVAPSNVEFLGFIPHSKKLYELYARALIFCFPSTGEPLGMVLQEAMAAGCAVVSTIPIDFYGGHVKPKSAEELANALKKLTVDRKYAEYCGRMNRKLAEKLTWDAYVESIEKVYQKVLK